MRAQKTFKRPERAVSMGSVPVIRRSQSTRCLAAVAGAVALVSCLGCAGTPPAEQMFRDTYREVRDVLLAEMEVSEPEDQWARNPFSARHPFSTIKPNMTPRALPPGNREDSHNPQVIVG